MSLFDFLRHRKQVYSEQKSTLGVFDCLSEKQKYAITSMLASLAYAPTSEQRHQVATKMFMTSVNMIGLSEGQLFQNMQSGQKMTPDEMLSIIGTINDMGIIHWLIYTAYGIVSTTGNAQANSYFHSWFNQLGYDDTYIQESIDKVELLGEMMRGK